MYSNRPLINQILWRQAARPLKQIFVAIMALVSAIGCETIEQQSASGQVRALSDAEKREVQTLIYDAEDAFANNHLGFTHDGNALTLYRQASDWIPKMHRRKEAWKRSLSTTSRWP